MFSVQWNLQILAKSLDKNISTSTKASQNHKQLTQKLYKIASTQICEHI